MQSASLSQSAKVVYTWEQAGEHVALTIIHWGLDTHCVSVRRLQRGAQMELTLFHIHSGSCWQACWLFLYCSAQVGVQAPVSVIRQALMLAHLSIDVVLQS